MGATEEPKEAATMASIFGSSCNFCKRITPKVVTNIKTNKNIKNSSKLISSCNWYSIAKFIPENIARPTIPTSKFLKTALIVILIIPSNVATGVMIGYFSIVSAIAENKALNKSMFKISQNTGVNYFRATILFRKIYIRSSELSLKFPFHFLHHKRR